MPFLDLLCLANSYKEGGRCVAGLRINGGGWVRPVTTAVGGALLRRQYQMPDRSEPRIFDIIRVGVKHHCPLPHQPENWLMDESSWTLLGRGSAGQCRGFLNNWVSRKIELLGDTRIAIPVFEFASHPMPWSLQLVRPCDLHWRVELHDGKLKARAGFRLGAMHYNLPFTDPDYHGVLLRRGVGRYSPIDMGLGQDADMLLTISLTEPFNGNCYKLVSALVILPS